MDLQHKEARRPALSKVFPLTFCVVDKALFPWMALVLGSKAKVDRVEIKFRDNCCGEMLRNIEVRVTDTLPTSGFPFRILHF